MRLYDLLGLDRGASAADVRRAYRRLVRRYHPDLNPGNQEAARRYEDITRAFETLNDPVRRRAYDEHGEIRPDERPPEVAFAGFDFTVAAHGGAASTFGDLFVDVFQAAAGLRPAHAPVAGADLHAEVTLSLSDVIHGATRMLQLTRRVRCDVCAGAGRIDRAPVRCGACQGAGQVRLARGHMTFLRPCDACGASGAIAYAPCPACQGSGHATRVEPHVMQLPAGLSDGDEWRERGQGHAGVGGGPPGDLRVRVRVPDDARWRRVDDDLHLTLPVAIHEAVLGTRVALETPDGPVRLRIPPGTQGGRRIRLRGRGVPSRRTGVRGDLVVTLHLVLPRVIDARGRALMAEFARLHPDDVRQDFESNEA